MKKHLPIDYWSLRLPKQTRDYVPLFLAYIEIFSHPKKYQLNLKPLTENLAWSSVALPSPMHLSQVASLAEISVATLRSYNPGYRRDVTGPHYTSILIPEYAARRMQEKLDNLNKGNKSLTEWSHYAVKRGDSLSQIAAKNHTTSNLIKYVNHLDNNKLKIHQNLYIPAHKKKLVIPILKQRNGMKIDANVVSELKLPGPKQLHYLVKEGDTRKKIARRLHVKEAQLIYWNGLGWNDKVIPGQHLNLWRKSSSKKQRKPIVYRIKPGDSLSSLAVKYQTTTAIIRKRNHLKNDNIMVGKKLLF